MPTNNIESSDVRCGDLTIHVSETGSGYPVILLHGGGPGANGLSNYARNIDALAQNFRVIVPDMKGYGGSTKGIDRSDPFGDLAAAMTALMDALGIEKAHFVGNSYGGACALRLALDTPDRVSALVLMGPGGVNTTRRLPTKGLKALFAYYGDNPPRRESLAQFIRDYLVFDVGDITEELIDQRYVASLDPEVIASPPLQRPMGLAAALKMDFTRDARLSGCQVPTLVLWGSEDKVNRPSGGETLRQAMPKCDLHLFARTGHWVQWERAGEFNAITAAFLARHSTDRVQGAIQ